jgi:IS1 family transposase/transposase-like protein
MVLVPIKCPHCGSDDVRKNGFSKTGKQRYICNNKDCSKSTFIEHYTNRAYDPAVRNQIYFNIVNGNGTRATARILGIAKDTVTDALRSIEHNLWFVNYDYISSHVNINAEIVLVEEAEMDEMWSFVHDKSHQCWLWWAIDHDTGEPLAFCFGTREHKNVDALLKLLSPFEIKVVYADDNYAYKSRLTDSDLITGKRNTQKIERKHLSLRTWCSRLVRKGIRFSKNERLHIIVVALVINFWFFSRIVW